MTGELLPVVEAVIDRCGDAAAVGHAAPLEFEPQLELRPQRLGQFLPPLVSMLRRHTREVPLDVVDLGQALDRRIGHWARPGLGHLVVLASGMHDTTCGYAPGVDARIHCGVVAGVLVSQQRAAPRAILAAEERDRILATTAQAELE